jgi:hypothetical protein
MVLCPILHAEILREYIMTKKPPRWINERA